MLGSKSVRMLSCSHLRFSPEKLAPSRCSSICCAASTFPTAEEVMRTAGAGLDRKEALHETHGPLHHFAVPLRAAPLVSLEGALVWGGGEIE